ncbi:MAG: hypothetical protein GF383_00565 [Candidatus Lokiarchaeota archaeon]|nr:hypothetical protein [Candidatus Lokiarchaeota archaeon]MBD3337659.1 hypothetical protein [Candidatus Lokiarchaeota archaeon]
MSDSKIKIHIIFIGKPRWEAGWRYIGYDNEELMNTILNHLKDKFPEIYFTSNDLLGIYDTNLVEKIKESILESHGVVIFTVGHYGYPGIIKAGKEFIEIGKSVILANLIYAGDHTFTKIFVSVKDKNLRLYPISSRNIEDFDEPIEVMSNLLRWQGTKILVYASDKIQMDWDVILGLFNPERKKILKESPEFIEQVGKMSVDKSFQFYTDTEGFDQAHQWRKDENKYSNKLKKLINAEMIRGDPDEIVEFYKRVNEKKAEHIAKNWIKNAQNVEPTNKTIINSAKLYLAFKKILNEKNCRIFAPDCGTFLLTGKLPAYPCMAFYELSNEGYYGICESDMDSAISFIFGLALTGRPGFVSNHTFDSVNDQITYMHCVAPSKLYGLDGPKADYEILYHGETAYLGASPCVKFPVGEDITTIKISVFENKIEIRSGKIVNNLTEKGGCVSKVLVKSKVKHILDNYDWKSFGWHRVSFIGDWVEEFIIGAHLLGLEIVNLTF